MTNTNFYVLGPIPILYEDDRDMKHFAPDYRCADKTCPCQPNLWPSALLSQYTATQRHKAAAAAQDTTPTEVLGDMPAYLIPGEVSDETFRIPTARRRRVGWQRRLRHRYLALQDWVVMTVIHDTSWVKLPLLIFSLLVLIVLIVVAIAAVHR